MGGGAWPFLVGGAICLVNSVNERDLSLLTSYVEIIAIVGLKRGIPSKRESSARVDYVPALCTHRPSLLPIEWSGEVLGSRRRGRFAAGDPSLKIGRLCCPNCSLEKRPQRRTGPKSPGRGRRRGQRVLEIVGREANGGRRCVPVGCGTALAGLPIDSGRGPVRIGAAAKAWAVDRAVEMPSCRLWLAARAVTACLGTCALPAPACGHPIRPVLKHGPRRFECEHACRDPKDGELCLSGAKPEETLVEARSDTDVQILVPSEVSLRIAGARVRVLSGRCGCFVEPCHGIESSKWAIFGKQNWRCGMNRKPGYGAKLRANLEPTKGVGRLRQQDGGHGSRNPLRSV
ncbi:hypothetical protein LXL04_039443 [Taraxacum kok-saghyz]